MSDHAQRRPRYCTCPCSCDETPHDGKPCEIHDVPVAQRRGSDDRLRSALRNAVALLEADAKIDAFNGTVSKSREFVLEMAQTALSSTDRCVEGPMMPAKLTGELACIIECCDPPEKQTDEAVERLIFDYQPMWDRLRATLSSTDSAKEKNNG